MGELSCRPYDAVGDLESVYELAEVAYAEDFARMGREAKAGMERERKAVAVLHFLSRIFPKLRDANPGYVWEVDGKVVSLVNFSRLGLAGDSWSIETVATHPDFRRRGLARMLVERAMEDICARGGTSCTLKVRSDNESAQDLYRSFGFRHFDTTLQMRLDHLPAGVGRNVSEYEVERLRFRSWYTCWRHRLDLAKREIPSCVQAFHPFSRSQFRKPWFARLIAPALLKLSGVSVARHQLQEDGMLIGTVAVDADLSGEKTHALTVCMDPAHAERIAMALVDCGLQALESFPRAVVLTEARDSNQALLNALTGRGFHVASTWHWLGKSLRS